MLYFKPRLPKEHREVLLLVAARFMQVQLSSWPAWIHGYMNKRQRSMTTPWGVFLADVHLKDMAVIAHELQHVRQAEATGWAWWLCKYFCSSKFRMDQEQEGEAHEALMRALLARCEITLDSLRQFVSARALSTGQGPYCIRVSSPAKVISSIAERAYQLYLDSI